MIHLELACPDVKKQEKGDIIIGQFGRTSSLTMQAVFNAPSGTLPLLLGGYVRGRLKSVAGIVIETFESLALSTSHYARGFPLIKFMTKSRAEATWRGFSASLSCPTPRGWARALVRRGMATVPILSLSCLGEVWSCLGLVFVFFW